MTDLRWRHIGRAVCFWLVISAAPAAAQGIGLGPRISFQRGDADVPGSSSLRLLGGQVRFGLSPHTALEISADYSSSLDESFTERVKSLPLQASLLVFPVRATVSPYLLAGLGWYTQSSTVVMPGAPPASETVREMGYHAGVGAEVKVGKHIGLHGDYRYTHIRFGDGEPAAAGAVPIPGLSALQQKLKLSHQGSALSWGATFYF